MFASATTAGSVPLDLIKALRARTNAPILQCKVALTASDGNLEQAHRHLRTIGLASAADEATRPTSQGVVACASDNRGAVMIELQTETDFVAKNSRFLSMAEHLSQVALKYCQRFDSWNNVNVHKIKEIAREDFADTLLALRENIVLSSIRGFPLAPEQKLATYIHNRSAAYDEIGQIGVIMRYTGDEEQIARQVAMHIAVAAPIYIRPSDIPDRVVEAERGILTNQALTLGKSPAVTEGIVQGKLKKWRSDQALLEQTFALGDEGKIISEMLGAIEINGFERMRIGELN